MHGRHSPHPTYGTPRPLRVLSQSELAGEVKRVEWKGSRDQGEKNIEEHRDVGNHLGLHRDLSDSLTHTCTLPHSHIRNCAVHSLSNHPRQPCHTHKCSHRSI